MTSVPSPSAIKKIEIYSLWVGFADPPSHSAKLTINNVGNRLVRQQALDEKSDVLPEPVISRLMRALARPAISRLDPAIFNVPAAVIDQHYNSCWTDDYPSLLIRINCKEGRHITIRSDAQYAFMLPLKVTDSEAAAPYETFDPELSRALADLLPEGYLGRDRLVGRLGMLEWDREVTEHKESETVPETAPVCDQSEPVRFESVPPVELAELPGESNDDVSGPTPSTEDMEAVLSVRK